MKKLYLILLITFFCGAKGFCQLLNSNNLGETNKTDPIPHLKEVPNSSDAFIGNMSLNIDVDTFKNLVEKHEADRKVNEALFAERDKMLADKAKTNEEIKKLNDLNSQLAERLKVSETEVKKISDDKLALYQQINGLVEEGYTFYFNELDKEIAEYEKETGESAKQALEGSKKITGTTENALVNSYFSGRNEVIATKLADLKAARHRLHAKFEKLKPWSALTDDERIKAIVYEKILTAINDLEKEKKSFITQKNEFAKDYKVYLEATNKDIDELNKIKKEDEETVGEDEKLAAIGGITTLLGEHNVVIPNISIVGQKKFVAKEHSSIYGEVKLIVGANDNDKKNQGVEKMFIPEASTFGFMTDFTFGFNPSDKNPSFNKTSDRYDQSLAINLGVYYLGKKLQPDTLTSFNVSLFQLKLGVEYVIIPSALSVYLNTNHTLITTNIGKFENHYSEANRVRSYMTFGMQSLLDLTERKDLFLQINLGFVKVNNDINSWLRTNDSVIPNVKFTLVKKL